MLQATLDLLDAALRQEHERYTSHSSRDRQRLFKQPFQIDPVQWAKFDPYFRGLQLKWIEFRYKDAVSADNLDALIASDEPGLYIFSVRPDYLIGPFPQFALYAGISGDRDSQRPLRERLKDYLRLSSVRKRGNIEQMLQLYYPYIWVSYTLLNWSSSKLKELETNMHEHLGLPFASQAYTPETKAGKDAWPQ